MYGAILAALVSVVPVYTNHNRVAGWTPTMTNIEAWAEAVTNAIAQGGGSIDTQAVTNIVEGYGYATKKYTSSVCGAMLTTSKAYTDKAVASATPGDYLEVSNKAYAAATHIAVTNIVETKVPAWALEANPPEGMTGNAAVLTNGVLKTKAGTEITAANVGAADINSIENLKTIVYTWESFLDGSNVVFSITNYLSGTYNLGAAKLRILEMTNGIYREVYNSRDEIALHLTHFETNTFAAPTNAMTESFGLSLAGLDSAKADKAWGKYTSAGGVAESNTVYMTAPRTVFAGGMEYERVAVGEGTIAVLTTKGAPTYTAGDEGTFKFQDAGGTNYFGYAKSDSYVIGCNTDGISVSDHLVTLTYNVTMSGVPCIWYKADLQDGIAWEQLNTSDGEPVEGASHVVQWEENPDPDTEVCYLNCPEAKGFFKATIEVPGSAKFITNMPADLGGGIFCTDGEHRVKVDYNGGSPKLVVVED